MKPLHGAPVETEIPSDLVEIDPHNTGLKKGDKVTFTNDYGVKFERKTVKGFTPEVTSWGACVYIDTDCWWHPTKPENLQKEMPAYKVTCDDGDHWITSMNATYEQAKEYFLDRTFVASENFETGEEKFHKVISVEQL